MADLNNSFKYCGNCNNKGKLPSTGYRAMGVCDICKKPIKEEESYILDHQGYSETLCPECGRKNKLAVPFKEFIGG